MVKHTRKNPSWLLSFSFYVSSVIHHPLVKRVYYPDCGGPLVSVVLQTRTKDSPRGPRVRVRESWFVIPTRTKDYIIYFLSKLFSLPLFSIFSEFLVVELFDKFNL
jgi:hypothetical protein